MTAAAWPRGSTQAQLATIDDRLDAIGAALREARGNHETAVLDELEARRDELRADRSRVTAAAEPTL